MPDRNNVQELCQRVIRRCGADNAEVLVFVDDSALTRFANNTIHQNVAERDTNLLLRYFIGKRMGTATTNRIDEAALDELAARARQNAQASPEDPAYPGLPEPAQYAPAEAYNPETAQYDPKARAQAVAVVCRLAGEKKLNASGAFSTGSAELAIANSQGLFAHHVSTHADFQTVVMSDDSSGRAHASGWRAAEIPVEALGREAIDKAERGRGPQKIEPGEYTVVFDPYVTEDLLQMLAFYGISAQALLEGRSWMNDRLGQQAMSRQINIWDDGLDTRGIPIPFDFEGVPKQRVEIVKEGVVIGPVYDRYTGQKSSHASTGHAMPPTFRGMGPIPTNLFMAAGETSTQEMIHSTQKGLYITRFWYTRLVHPKDCVITGMTRDGVFLIEHGEIAYPVKNLRFTQSYVEALNHVETVGREARLLSSEFGGLAVHAPALKISQFNFTGSTV
jgi:predicted Zn-dependent protease